MSPPSKRKYSPINFLLEASYEWSIIMANKWLVCLHQRYLITRLYFFKHLPSIKDRLNPPVKLEPVPKSFQWAATGISLNHIYFPQPSALYRSAA
jgi:hypothetical protein